MIKHKFHLQVTHIIVHEMSDLTLKIRCKPIQPLHPDGIHLNIAICEEYTYT